MHHISNTKGRVDFDNQKSGVATVFKISEKVSFNIASEASYEYILTGQKSIENVPFLGVIENLKLGVK